MPFHSSFQNLLKTKNKQNNIQTKQSNAIDNLFLYFVVAVDWVTFVALLYSIQFLNRQLQTQFYCKYYLRLLVSSLWP